MLRMAGFAVVLALTAGAAQAASVSYYMDQSNLTNSPLMDGTHFLRVTIDDEGNPGDINFTVETLSPLNDLAASNFGIQTFAFNTLVAVSDIDESQLITGLPVGWDTNVIPPNNNEGGFGVFDIAVNGSGNTRVSTLTFSLTGIEGALIESYLELSETNNGMEPPEGSVFFVAHVADFDDQFGNSSAFFGGSTPVPLPPTILVLATSLAGLAFFRRRVSTD